MTKNYKPIVLGVATVSGGAAGALLGATAAMWGGIEIILPITTVVFAGLGYVCCRMALAALDAFRG